MVHVLISQLSCGDLNRRILARVSRLWDFCDLNDKTNIFHTDLVLLDQMGNSIHAQIYKPAIEILKPLIQEQKVYYIDSFTVRYANRSYRPVENGLMILFSKWTTLEECIDPPADFPSVTFSLTSFQDIPALVDKTQSYVDVMGVITEVGAPATVRPKSRNGDSLKRTIQICDASNSTLPVTIWGDRASDFDADAIYNAGQTQPQIIVFVGTLVKDYTGLGLTVTGSSPCKWYLNLNIPEVLELRESFNAEFRAIAWVDDPTTGFSQDATEEKKIAEILALNPHKNKATRFIVKVTVKRICADSSWWYNSCRMCYRTSKPYGSTYKCSACSNIGIPDPRYKVVVIAGDDSCDATFILFGRIAQRLIRKPVESLIEDNPPDSEPIPPEIGALVDSTFVWNVSFTRDTVKRSQESLQVNSIVSFASSSQEMLLISPGASATASAIVSASSSSSIQIGPAPSETSIGSQQLVKASTPTKLNISSPTHATPTSKLSSSTRSKKSIVVSMSHMQFGSPNLGPDNKADTGAEDSASQQDKAKQLAKHADNTTQAALSPPTETAKKKRASSTIVTPTAKKLFKDV